jgi:hypothetical protein
MKSKFRFWAYFVTFNAVFFSIILFLTLSHKVFNPTMPLIFFLFFSLFFVYVWIWLIFGELRSKIISIDIEYNSFNIKRYLGLGISKTYYFDQLDGYKTSILSSRSGSYEYLYLMIGKRKIAKLSEYYHKNYHELKRAIFSQNIKNLGFESYSFIREVKEIFT